MYNLIIILLSVMLNATAQIFLKKGAVQITHFGLHSSNLIYILGKIIAPEFIMGFFCYGVSIFLWIYSLSKVQLSIAYPIQAVGYVVVMLASIFIFNEAFTISKAIGALLIIAGVVCITWQLG